jgi:hypothetical protein
VNVPFSPSPRGGRLRSEPPILHRRRQIAADDRSSRLIIAVEQEIKLLIS